MGVGIERSMYRKEDVRHERLRRWQDLLVLIEVVACGLCCNQVLPGCLALAFMQRVACVQSRPGRLGPYVSQAVPARVWEALLYLDCPHMVYVGPLQRLLIHLIHLQLRRAGLPNQDTLALELSNVHIMWHKRDDSCGGSPGLQSALGG